ncbi:MAG: M56 family metallopeptidase [Pseudomonadales bacterium]|nr:M56 family metallopeptidase [Pseudomonadales bacterium]
MLINESAIVFNLLSIALMGLLAAAAVLVLIWPLLARCFALFSAGTQKKLLWLLVVTPWLASSLCLFIFLPSVFQLETTLWLTPLAHWHHPYVFYLDSWHGAALFLFMLGTAYVLIKNALGAVRHLNALDLLTRLSNQSPRSQIQYNARQWVFGRDIIVLESRTPAAFAAGLLNPRCYVTTGLIAQVSEAELDIIVAHERAHIKHKDIQKKLLFALLAALYPKPITQRLNRLFSLATEQLADAHVSRCYSVFDIAQTLVNAAKIMRFSVGNGSAASINHFIAGDVDVRVRALVTPQKFRSFPWAYCLLIMMLTTTLSFAGIDTLHHLIEAIFSH